MVVPTECGLEALYLYSHSAKNRASQCKYCSPQTRVTGKKILAIAQAVI